MRKPLIVALSVIGYLGMSDELLYATFVGVFVWGRGRLVSEEWSDIGFVVAVLLAFIIPVIHRARARLFLVCKDLLSGRFILIWKYAWWAIIAFAIIIRFSSY